MTAPATTGPRAGDAGLPRLLAQPDESHTHFDLDTYASAELEAREAVAATGPRSCSRPQPLRALDERAHPGDGQPAGAGLALQLPRRRTAPRGPGAFLDTAAKVPGSWWPDYADWLAVRSGELRPAPKRLGGRGHRALGKAPGTYVFAR